MARVTPEGLARLGIALDALTLAGETTADLTVTLPQGARPVLTLRSDLIGMATALPVLGGDKARDAAAPFEVTATLGGVPSVDRLTIDAPGLRAEGRIALTDDVTLDRAVFDRVRTPWFDGAVTLAGRGAAFPRPSPSRPVAPTCARHPSAAGMAARAVLSRSRSPRSR